MMKPIKMVDLQAQFHKIKDEVLSRMEHIMENSSFINGPEVQEFARELGTYLDVDHVIPCANGTDALQIGLMSLDLEPGDEVLIPSFNYIALAEVVALLGLKPVFCDVNEAFFTLDPQDVEQKITSKSRVIAPVHLFGQTAPMEALIRVGQKYNLHIIEDNAQAIGAQYSFSDGTQKAAGTLGCVGTTSFFPSKNLGCYGDGGALFTRDQSRASRMQSIANHGQKTKYYHDWVGVNSRLDTLQAAVLLAKLPHLNNYIHARQKVADFYNNALSHLKPLLITPQKSPYSDHVYHQYTLTLADTQTRDGLRGYLSAVKIPTMIYYPLPIHQQKAYKTEVRLPVSESLSTRVLSLPISTELSTDQLEYICYHVTHFFEKELYLNKG